MQNTIIGIIIGVVLGVVMGATVIAPRLNAVIPEQNETVEGEGGPIVANTQAPQGAIALPGGGLARPSDRQSETTKAITWRMASAHSADLQHLGSQAKRLSTEIWLASEGQFQIEFHEPEALVPRADSFAAVKSGAIEAAFITPDLWPKQVPALQLFGAIPFGPNAEEYLAWLYFGGGVTLLEDIAEKHGVVALVCGMTAAESGGWFRKSVRTPDDLTGLRLRMEGFGAQVMERLGAEIIPLQEGDILGALESGALDAAEFSLPSVDQALGLPALVDTLYFPGWHQPSTALVLIIHPERWEELDALAQDRLRRVCGDNVRHGLAEGEAVQTATLVALSSAGTRVTRWPASLLDTLKTNWEALAKAKAAADDDFNRVWKSLSQFRTEYDIWRDLNRLP